LVDVDASVADGGFVLPKRCQLFVSSEFAGVIGPRLGDAHYSYRFVADRFVTALERSGYSPIWVDMPEKFKRPADLRARFGAAEGTPVHITFRSSTNMRPMSVALNICHFVWEFDVLKDHHLITEPVTSDQKHMLSLMDEIWVPSTYTYDILRRHGLNNVQVVPTPVCQTAPEPLSVEDSLAAIGTLATAPLLLSTGLPARLNADLVSGAIDALAKRVAACRDGGGRIFLTVCNPHDVRKNILNAIDGFLLGTEGGSDLLIIKLAVNTGGALLDTDLITHLADRYRGPAAVSAPRVLIISDFLTRPQMDALYTLADFYLSCSHCEGFNLPLLEAMSHGTVPVTTCNTAMRDYIDAANAIVIRERQYHGVVPGLAGEISGWTPMISVADRFDIAFGVHAARQITSEVYARMGMHARSRVVQQYGEPTIMQIVENRLSDLVARNGTVNGVTRN
jgi:glycosyltransferase involved in cell wall biosynthesis